MYQEHIVYKGTKEFSNLQIKEIALRYANTPYNWSAKAIATEYSRDGEYTIKARTISNIVQKAIKNALVSEEIAKKIKEKAVFNAARHSKYNAMVTSDKYDELIMQRREFIENGYKKFRKTKVQEMPEPFENVEDYANRVKFEEEYLLSKIALLTHQIETFESHCIDECDSMSKDELIREKNEIVEKLKKLKFYNPL